MIIDENDKEIINPDLENGYLIDITIAKPGAYETIDNVTKYALDDADYIPAQRYIAIDPKEKAAQEAETKKRIDRERFLNTAPTQISDIMQAVAELGVLFTGGRK